MSDIYFIDGSHIQVKESPEEIFADADPIAPGLGTMRKCHRDADNRVVLVNLESISYVLPC